MSSRVPANVNFSLEEFSRHGGLTGPHKDGWGVAFYGDKDVRLIKEPEPASDSDCARFIAKHHWRSRIVISHVRRATQGARTLENTQPFARELGGHMQVFAHNGDLGAVRQQTHLRLGRFRPVGETDSEYAFCVLLAWMEERWLSAGPPPLAERLDLVARFAAAIRPLGPANFLYADGEFLFVHGHRRRHEGQTGYHPPGVHTLHRTCAAELSAVSVPGLHIATASGPQEVVLAASVPLTMEPWTPAPEGAVIAIANGHVVARADP